MAASPFLEEYKAFRGQVPLQKVRISFLYEALQFYSTVPFLPPAGTLVIATPIALVSTPHFLPSNFLLLVNILVLDSKRPPLERFRKNSGATMVRRAFCCFCYRRHQEQFLSRSDLMTDSIQQTLAPNKVCRLFASLVLPVQRTLSSNRS